MSDEITLSSIPDLDDNQLVEKMETDLDTQVRDAARKHTPKAISTLATLMRSTKTPPGVRRQCAVDLLAQGWGRPDSREDAAGQRQGKGLTVNIIRLSDGGQTTIDMDVHEAKRIAASVDASSKE